MMNRTRTLTVGVLAASLALAMSAASAANALSPNQLATHVARAQAGRPLTSPSQAAPGTVIAGYLRARGKSDRTLRSLLLVSQQTDWRRDRTHVRMTQQVAGLPVYDTYVKATLDRRGALVSLIENLAPVPATGVARAAIDERRALAAAFRSLKLTGTVPDVAGRHGNLTTFARGQRFLEQPRVTRVAVPMSDGTMSTGFLVQTWQRAGNLLHETLVDGGGRVVEVVRRTNSDSYNVFAVDPDKTPQAVVSGVPDWLFPGNHRSIDIAGNSVHAYLDAVNDSVPDSGGTTVGDGNFLAVFDAGIQPSEPVNRAVAVQNLFFLNNVIHDTLYAYGFDEAAGNFQEDNFGLGARGSDSVNAEAQDGGGTDNANFATPRDGQNPRMQMYLWSSPSPDHEVVVNAPDGIAPMPARRAQFGAALDATGLTGDAVLVDDAVAGGTASDGCEPIVNDVSGKIAIIDRGFCTFAIKAKNAQNAGAVGVIVANNAGAPIVMGGDDATITIPALMVGQSDGATLKGLAGVNATMRLLDPPPIMRDGDVDSDIVWHEYGHGLTWRMIGRMDGPMSGAIGEGMSDVLSIVINNDDVVGEYSFGIPAGIRSEPYANYSRTYADVTGTEVHFDGELYGAIGWRLWQNFQNAGQDRNTMLGYVVDGMNYTRAHPTFEAMRDGILAATAGSGFECQVWDAFAHYGVGVGAKGAVRGSRIVVTESFVKPAGCQ